MGRTRKCEGSGSWSDATGSDERAARTSWDAIAWAQGMLGLFSGSDMTKHI
jgi:hypothetical protein